VKLAIRERETDAQGRAWAVTLVQDKIPAGPG
jgi:hypothetical protein